MDINDCCFDKMVDQSCSTFPRDPVIPKGSTINDQEDGGKIENGFVFSMGMPFENYFFLEKERPLEIYFFRRGPVEVYFCPGKGPPIFFLDFLRASPQIINSCPLTEMRQISSPNYFYFQT